MDGNSGSYDNGTYLQVPLHDRNYNITADPFLQTLVEDPFTKFASLQVYLLEILSAFAIILVLPSFIWHIRNRNFPATCLVFWVLWRNLMNLVNALIWPTDDIATWWWGYGLCDISVKMDVASPIGIVGAVICILRALAAALDTDRIRLVPRRTEAVRKRIIELLFCIGLPLLAGLLHYFVQSRRYYIYAISGCMYTVGDTWVTVLLIWMWPPFLAFVAAYYAGLVIVRVLKYRREFRTVLSASSSGLNQSRFYRLFAISIVLLVVYLPVEVYVLVWNITLTPLGAYSWSDIHSAETWDYLLFFPTYGEVFFDRWIYASLGYALFFTLGLGADATQFWRALLRTFGLQGIFPSLRTKIGSGGSRDRSRELTDSTTTITTATSKSLSTNSTTNKASQYWSWISHKLGPMTALLHSSGADGPAGTGASTTGRRSETSKAWSNATTSALLTEDKASELAFALVALNGSARMRNERALSDVTAVESLPLGCLAALGANNGMAALLERGGIGGGGDGLPEGSTLPSMREGDGRRESILGGIRAWAPDRAGTGDAEDQLRNGKTQSGADRCVLGDDMV